jgi:CubicO group peptidase (beta-lactamase class C family)
LPRPKKRTLKLLTHSVCFSLIIFLFNDSVLADGVDDFLRAKMAEENIPGLQLAVVKNRTIIKTASYGVANVQDKVSVDSTTLFNLASITKAFTCVAVMQLVEQGKLELSTSISTYVPDLPIAWQKISLKQLLSHTSGLPDIMNEHFQLIDSAGEEQSWQALQQRTVYFEPGTAFHYNQTNYLLVGKIIEQVSEKNYAELISEYQLNAENLSRTHSAGFAHFQSMNPHQARDYRLNQQGDLADVLTSFPSIIRAGVGMSSTASELAYWTIQLQNGAFFEDSTSLSVLWKTAKLSSETWATENPSMHPYALGWFAVEREKNTKIVTAGGGQSAVAVYPNDDLSIVILTNLAGARPENLVDDVAEFYVQNFGLSDKVEVLKQKLEQQGYNNALSIAQEIQKEQKYKFNTSELNHFGNLLVKHLKKEQANQIFNLNNHLYSHIILKSQILDKYVGIYEFAEFSINVTRESNALFITATGESRLPIFSKTETEFFLKAIDATISFSQDEDGSVTGLLLGINGENLSGRKTK